MAPLGHFHDINYYFYMTVGGFASNFMLFNDYLSFLLLFCYTSSPAKFLIDLYLCDFCF